MQKLICRNSKGQEVKLGNSRPFLLEKIENGANTSANISVSNNLGDGVSIDDISIKERLLPISAAIYAKNKEDLELKRAYLTSLFNPKLGEMEFIYTNNALTKRVKGVVQDITFQTPVGLMQKFLIQLLTPSPFWMDEFVLKEEVALWVGDFEFTLEISNEGIEMGHRVSNLICNVINNGDIECGMKIQFKALATVDNPSLFNVNTREYIKINRTLEAGDLLEITTEFANKRIELVKSNYERINVFNWIDLDSEFLQLEVGDNLFRYDADVGIDNLEMSIYYNPLYLGV